LLKDEYLDLEIIHKIIYLNIKNALLLFIIAYLLFLFLPRRLFPQRYAGAGIENIISNILYMLAYIEIVVPLMVFLKIFTLPSFLAVLFLTKLAFVKFYYKQDPKEYLLNLKSKILIVVYDFLDDPYQKIISLRKQLYNVLFLYVKNLNYYQFFKKILLGLIFIHLVYIVGYRCFISLANPLPDTSQFFEWVANLNDNILYADDKTAGADFYGISVFIFFLQTFTHIDSIILFNIYPLLLITFLFLGVYFVMKRFTLTSLLAMATLLIYGSILLSSPWNEHIATWITTTSNPDFIRFWHFKLYQIPKEYFENPNLHLEKVSMTPYIRYFSGMAYEFSSTMFLINLFYLIKALDRGYTRYLYNYSLSLMLVFIFHGGGAIALIAPSILIALNALVSFKLNLDLLKRGLKAILFAAILGNGWMLSVLKYGIPQDFGAAAPFLDRLFGTKQAIKEIVSAGIEEVTISHLTYMHLFLLISAISFFILARFFKKGFYFSSFLLIPLGFFVVYYAENLGLSKLVHPSRGAEYLYLSITVIVACYLKLFLWIPLKKLLGELAKIVFLVIVFIMLLISIFLIPHYKEVEFFKRFINGVQYSEIPYHLYQIVKENRPMTWTVISYVQEYSKVLGKGFMINTNEFLLDYSPLPQELPIPTPKVYIFVEDIPHKYTGKDEWYYRWRTEIQNRLKEWVTIYASTHDNIRVYAKTKLLTVYEIDNSAYVERLKRERDGK